MSLSKKSIGLPLIYWVVAVVGCGRVSDDSVRRMGSGNVIKNDYAIEASFSRLDGPGLDPVRCTVLLTNHGIALPGMGNRLIVASARGSLGMISELGQGKYQFDLTPSGTGEYPLSISFENAQLNRTPIVLEDVDPGL